MAGEPMHLGDDKVSMKPMLGKLVEEAVKLALIDSVLADAVDQLVSDGEMERWVATSDRLRAEWTEDIDSMPGELLAKMSPLALAQNVGCRLFGTGGWSVSGTYAPNASAREVLEATFARPDQRHVDETMFDIRRAIEGGPDGG